MPELLKPSRRRAGAAMLLLATVFATPGHAGTKGGPLAVDDLFPVRRGFLSPSPEPVSPLEPGVWQLDVLISAANTLAGSRPIEPALEAREARGPVTVDLLRQFDDGSGVLFLDGEEQAVRLKVGYGFPGGWQLGFELPVLFFEGGHLDGFAEGFHTLFGLDQDGRLGLVKDDYFLFISSGRGEVLEDKEEGSGVGDLTLKAKRTLPSSGRWQRSFDAALKLPTGNERRLMSSGSTDIGLRFLTSRPYGRWHLHGGAGMVYLGPWETLGTPSQVRLSGFAAIERVHNNGASTVLQLVGLQSPFETLGVAELDRASYQLTLGSHVPLAKSHRLTLAVTENVLSFDSGTDFAFHVGVSLARR